MFNRDGKSLLCVPFVMNLLFSFVFFWRLIGELSWLLSNNFKKR